MPADAQHAPPVQSVRQPNRTFTRFMLGAGLSIAVIGAAIGGGVAHALSPTRGAQYMAPESAKATNAQTVPALQLALEEVAKNVGPAVVSVRTDQGLGSGVLYDPDGLLLTNAHVVESAQSITVALVDGRHFAGKVLGTDTGFDVAVIKIDGHNLPTASLGTSTDLQVGEFVLAIGNPYGFDHTLTTGVVSALDRPVSEGQASYNQPMIQTDAAINPGNSGGPLLDLQGDVVGITTLIAAPQGFPAQGLGFAVPVDTAKRIADQLVQSGNVTHSGMPYLGVSLADINRPTSVPNLPGLPPFPGFPGPQRPSLPQAPVGVDHGALVEEVAPDGPLAQAGIQIGDVITGFDGVDIYNPDELLQRLVLHKPGDQVPVTIVANRQTVTYTVTIGEAPVK